jgi:hypothetical protein
MTDVARRGRAVIPHGRQPFAQPGQHRRGCNRVALVQGKQVFAGEVLDDRDIGWVVGAIAVQKIDLRNPEAQGREPALRGLEQVGAVRVGELVSAVSDTRPVWPEVLRVLPQVRDRRPAVIHGQAVDTFLRPARQPGNAVQRAHGAERRLGCSG